MEVIGHLQKETYHTLSLFSVVRLNSNNGMVLSTCVPPEMIAPHIPFLPNCSEKIAFLPTCSEKIAFLPNSGFSQ